MLGKPTSQTYKVSLQKSIRQKEIMILSFAVVDILSILSHYIHSVNYAVLSIKLCVCI